ncbi:MAG TPA: hypothetical protein VH539_02200 [Gemmatimonadaceae bacterium]
MTRLRTAGLGLLCLGAVSASAPRAGEATWVNVTKAAEWSPGYSFTALDLRDTLWLLGHRLGDWYSTDGAHWTKESARAGASSAYNVHVVLNGAIYAIGGAENQLRPSHRAVWKSLNGRDWQLVTDHPPWSARVWHSAVVHDGRIWLVGGYDGTYRNDVWFSTDGSHWQLATAEAPWSGRCMHASVAFAGRLWVLGGRRDMERWWETDFNDVWSSLDGVTWARATGSAGWSKRYGIAAATWDDKLWVMGGGRFARSNDVWSSADGISWTSHGHAAWTPRFGLASVVFRDKLWVLGGKEGGGHFTNDVWFLAR